MTYTGKIQQSATIQSNDKYELLSNLKDLCTRYGEGDFYIYDDNTGRLVCHGVQTVNGYQEFWTLDHILDEGRVVNP